MYKRQLNILKSNSFFLFGARGTGKTSLIREIFSSDSTFWINLLEGEEEERYQLNPDSLVERIDAQKTRPTWVVIDEVQKVPKLLDLVHQLIERKDNKDRNLKFALTGSSARKLKKGSANLLAGRAFTNHLYPLTYQELGDDFNLLDALAWGSLPFVINSKDEREKKSFLDSYTATYLKEEIIAEQLIRNTVPFRKFLPIASQCSGTILNLSKIARDLGVDWSTVKNYFEILEDTLLGFSLPAYDRSLRKQQLSAPKFYLFDLGIKRALDKTLSLKPTTGQIIGPLFEQFIVCEAHRLNHYLDRDFTFSYLATQGGLEIDLVVERPGAKTALVEIKSGNHVHEQKLRHLKTLVDEFDNYEGFCLSGERHARKVDNVFVLPWDEGLKEIGLV